MHTAAATLPVVLGDDDPSYRIGHADPCRSLKLFGQTIGSRTFERLSSPERSPRTPSPTLCHAPTAAPHPAQGWTPVVPFLPFAPLSPGCLSRGTTCTSAPVSPPRPRPRSRSP